MTGKEDKKYEIKGPLTEKDSNKTITLKNEKDVFFVSLVTNPSTGYSWTYVDPSQELGGENVFAITSKTAPAANPHGMVGVPSKVIFRLKPTSHFVAGKQYTVKFEYKRPWEKTTAAKTITYYVVSK